MMHKSVAWPGSVHLYFINALTSLLLCFLGRGGVLTVSWYCLSSYVFRGIISIFFLSTFPHHRSSFTEPNHRDRYCLLWLRPFTPATTQPAAKLARWRGVVYYFLCLILMFCFMEEVIFPFVNQLCLEYECNTGNT